MTEEHPETEIPTTSPYAEEPESEGKAGRILLTLLVLVLAIGTACLAHFRNHEAIQELLQRDQWVTRLIGNLHPLFLLLPIGLILMVLLVELTGWFSFGKLRPRTKVPLFFAALFAILACLSGLVLMQLEGNTGPNWLQYLWYGVGAMGALSLAYLFKLWGDRRKGLQFLFALFFLGAIAAFSFGVYSLNKEVPTYTVIPPASGELTSPFASKNTIAGLNSTVSRQTSEAEVMTKDLDLKEKAISSLTSAKEATEAILKQEKAKLAQTQQNLAQVKKQLTERSQELQKKERDLQDLTARKEAVQEQLAGVEERLASAETQSQIQSEEITKFQDQVQKAAELEQKLRSEAEALKKDIAKLKEKQTAPPIQKPAPVEEPIVPEETPEVTPAE